MLEHEDLPEMTILIPVYERHEFLPLVMMNIKGQDYPQEKLKVIIFECESANPFIDHLDYFRDAMHPIQVTHMTSNQRLTIGDKRNKLIKNCKTKYFAFMDSDDLYLPTYLRYSYSMLVESKAKLVGSNKMIFTHVNDNFRMTKLDCGPKTSLIHEATMMSSVKYFNSTCKFAKNSQGEGVNLFQGLSKKDVYITNVEPCMICIDHGRNTVPKDNFNKENHYLPDDYNLGDEIKQLITQVLLRGEAIRKGKEESPQIPKNQPDPL
jgi:glycosyltransferase involved in cell wall biosynthesis